MNIRSIVAKVAAVATTVVAAGMLSVATSGAAQAATPTCHPIASSELSDFKVTNTDGSTLGTNGVVSNWQSTKTSFKLTLDDEHCAGDSVKIQFPTQFSTPSDVVGQIFPLKDADGNTVANMVMDSKGLVTVTLTDFVESHSGVSVNGWYQLQIWTKLTPGSNDSLVWSVDGKVVSSAPITWTNCTNCSAMNSWADKWGYYNPSDTTVRVTLVFPAATMDNQVFDWEDVATTDNQSFVCPSSLAVRTYSSRDGWGNPNYDANTATATITSCTDSKMSGTVTLKKGQAGQMYVTLKANDTAGPWADTFTVKSGGNLVDNASTSIKRASAGGDGSGTGTVTPKEPTVAGDTTCECNGVKKQAVLTIPSSTGVEYFVDGSKTAATAGTMNLTAGTHTVVAKAVAGKSLAAGAKSEWTFTIKSCECPVVTPPVVTPPVVVPPVVTPPAPPVTTPEPTTTTPAPPVTTPAPPVVTTPPAPKPEPKPVPVKMVSKSFQVDACTPKTAAAAKLLASLDNDGVLKYREDRGLWGMCKVQIVTIKVAADASTAQTMKALNSVLKVGKVSTTSTLSSAKVGKTVVTAWLMGNGASASAPWGKGKNVNQTFFARS